MNPQLSPWMKIADKQHQQSIEREQKQRQLQRIIKISYQKQLLNQMQFKRQQKKLSSQLEKTVEKQLLNKSLQSSQKTIDNEKLKNLVSNEKSIRIDLQNQFYQKIKKQRQDWMKSVEKEAANKVYFMAQEKQRLLKEEQEKRKQLLRQDLKGMIQFDRKFKKVNKDQENEFQDHKLKELKTIDQKMQMYRLKNYHEIKQRAILLEQKHHIKNSEIKNKSLVQKKKEQWLLQKQFLEHQQKLREIEKERKMNRQIHDNKFRNELRQQMTTNQKQKYIMKLKQQEQDRINNKKFMSLSELMDEQNKMIKNNKKKILHDELLYQIQEKEKGKKYQVYQMGEKQMKMNYKLLQSSQGIIPGETYHFDISRKKQLQSIAKSMNSELSEQKTSLYRYLQDIGRNMSN